MAEEQTNSSLVEDNLITALGLDELSEEKKIELIMKWGDIVQKDILMRTLKELPEKDKKALDKLLAEKGENWDEITAFIESRLPNFDDIVKEEIQKFREEILASVQV